MKTEFIDLVYFFVPSYISYGIKEYFRIINLLNILQINFLEVKLKSV